MRQSKFSDLEVPEYSIMDKVAEYGYDHLAKQEQIQLTLELLGYKYRNPGFRKLSDLFDAPVHKLKEHFTDEQVTKLESIKKLTAEYLKEELKAKTKISSPDECLDYLRLNLRGQEKEHMICVYLDAKNQVIKSQIHASGTNDQVVIYPKEVAKEALTVSASSVIMAHNHPSGEPEPSGADIRLTSAVFEACKTLDINVLDHMIIGEGNYFSFLEEGLLNSASVSKTKQKSNLKEEKIRFNPPFEKHQQEECAMNHQMEKTSEDHAGEERHEEAHKSTEILPGNLTGENLRLDIDSENILSPETKEHLKNMKEKKETSKGLTYDDVPEWRKNNPIDDKQLRTVKDSTLKDEITRLDIRKERRMFNRMKELHQLLRKPENAIYRQQIEMIDWEEKSIQTEEMKKFFSDFEKAMKKNHVPLHYKSLEVGKITKEDIKAYRKQHSEHVKWLEGMNRQSLENFTALQRMKAIRKINNRFTMEKINGICEKFPEEIKKILEKHNTLNPLREPFRTIQTNKEILDLGKANSRAV